MKFNLWVMKFVFAMIILRLGILPAVCQNQYDLGRFERCLLPLRVTQEAEMRGGEDSEEIQLESL